MMIELLDKTALGDLQNNVEHLRSQLNVLQGELDQSLSVWRTLLAEHRTEFKELLQTYEKNWEFQELEWQKERQMQAHAAAQAEQQFNQQLKAVDQNALKTLHELDAAWQRDKTEWQKNTSDQIQTLLDREQHYQHLDEENTQLKVRLQEADHQRNTDQSRFDELQKSIMDREEAERHRVETYITSLEAQLTEWRTQKASWQQSFSDRANVLQEHEALWAVERQRKDHYILSLQEEIVLLEARVRDTERTRQERQHQVEGYIASLESQIASLSNFVQQMFPASQHASRSVEEPFVLPGTDSVFETAGAPPADEPHS